MDVRPATGFGFHSSAFITSRAGLVANGFGSLVSLEYGGFWSGKLILGFNIFSSATSVLAVRLIWGFG